VDQPLVRPGTAADLPTVEAIQRASPQSAGWDVASYLQYDLRVATVDGQVAGFLVSRILCPGETEILNLAVAPGRRRCGVARALLGSLISACSGVFFLELRASNSAALNLYKSLGFQEVGRRPDYYLEPLEAAIVMKFHSC